MYRLSVKKIIYLDRFTLRTGKQREIMRLWHCTWSRPADWIDDRVLSHQKSRASSHRVEDTIHWGSLSRTTKRVPDIGVIRLMRTELVPRADRLLTEMKPSPRIRTFRSALDAPMIHELRASEPIQLSHIFYISHHHGMVRACWSIRKGRMWPRSTTPWNRESDRELMGYLAAEIQRGIRRESRCAEAHDETICVWNSMWGLRSNLLEESFVTVDWEGHLNYLISWE